MAITPVNTTALDLTNNPREISQKKAAKPTKNFNGEAVVFEKSEMKIVVTYSKTVISGDNDQGNINDAENVGSDAKIGTAEIVDLKKRIHDEIMAQVNNFLESYFEKNPGELELVKQGEIPEYFNEENTARRILDIYISQYTEGEDRSAFVENAKGIINQAYGESEEIAGTLPGIVLDTKALVMEMLDRFEKGEDISAFMNNIEGSNE